MQKSLIKNNPSHAVKKENSAVWHRSGGFLEAFSCRGNFQTLSAPACPEGLVFSAAVSR